MGGSVERDGGGLVSNRILLVLCTHPHILRGWKELIGRLILHRQKEDGVLPNVGSARECITGRTVEASFRFADWKTDGQLGDRLALQRFDETRPGFADAADSLHHLELFNFSDARLVNRVIAGQGYRL